MSTRIELTHATVLFSDRGDGDLGRPLDEASDAILANRAAIQALCGVRGIAVGRQIHGASVLVAGERPGYVVGGDEADGQATRTSGLGVGAHVADCLPIAIAGDGGVVMLHGGWRGLAAGIIDAGVAQLRALGVEGPLEAAIGPGAGGCCYETGPEVHAAFAGYGAGNGRLLDLGVVATVQLHAAGVASVSDVGICTLCAPPGMLFSHRRDGPTGERQGGFAWLR